MREDLRRLLTEVRYNHSLRSWLGNARSCFRQVPEPRSLGDVFNVHSGELRLTISRGRLLPVMVLLATVFLFSNLSSAQNGDACDLNHDGKVDILDAQLAVNMYMEKSPCTATIAGPGVCSSAMTQSVIAAALSGVCPAPLNVHTVTLSWTASSGVVGYNIYRGTISGGPYQKLTPYGTLRTSYVDGTVQARKTYYYVATAIDSSGNESAYSNQAQAIVPFP